MGLIGKLKVRVKSSVVAPIRVRVIVGVMVKSGGWDSPGSRVEATNGTALGVGLRLPILTLTLGLRLRIPILLIQPKGCNASSSARRMWSYFFPS